MSTSEELKKIVREKYGQIAVQEKAQNASSCCGATDTSEEIYNIMTDDYDDLEGYNPDADLGLGCGLPTFTSTLHQLFVRSNSCFGKKFLLFNQSVWENEKGIEEKKMYFNN